MPGAARECSSVVKPKVHLKQYQVKTSRRKNIAVHNIVKRTTPPSSVDVSSLIVKVKSTVMMFNITYRKYRLNATTED